jgi:phage terminase large subunit-like protein
MTDEEKDQERQFKRKTIKKVHSNKGNWYNSYKSKLDETDPRIMIYIRDVLEHLDDHNLYEILAIIKFFELLSVYTWKPGRVQRFFKFYEALKFSGIEGRRRYKLTPVQCFQFANIFGFVDARGLRLCRTACIFVPRKFSKTTSSAALAVYDLLFGDNNAQAYVGANSYDQAKICFDEIRNIMFDLDGRGRHFQINRESITFKDHGRDSLARCLTANAKTKDGFNASLVIMDEYAQARNTASKNGADLKNTLTSSMGARREPLVVTITTASEVIDGPFAQELDGYKRILRGEIKNDSAFAAIFQPDVDDREDDPHTWAKVQPHLGITVQPDYYEKEWANAQISAENRMVFRTKLLNIFAENEKKSWISAEIARNISRPMSLEDIKGSPLATVAIDLSVSGDFSAVTFAMYYEKEKEMLFHTAYFFPKDAIEGHANRRLYEVWAEKGYLILTPGAVIDYRVIVDYILSKIDLVRIRAIGYDPYKSMECVNMLKSAGAERVLVPVRQTYSNFVAPVESFDHGVKTGKIFINDNPINAYCFGNAVLDVDSNENCKPMKRGDNMKIDGVITMLMSLRLFLDMRS